MSFREVTNWISLAAMGFAVWLFLPPVLEAGSLATPVMAGLMHLRIN